MYEKSEQFLLSRGPNKFTVPPTLRLSQECLFFTKHVINLKVTYIRSLGLFWGRIFFVIGKLQLSLPAQFFQGKLSDGAQPLTFLPISNSDWRENFNGYSCYFARPTGCFQVSGICESNTQVWESLRGY